MAAAAARLSARSNGFIAGLSSITRLIRIKHGSLGKMGICNLFGWLIHCLPVRMFAPMKALLAATLVAGTSLVSAEAAKPNVLFVAVDDLKPTIGCYGNKLAKTPNIDRIAATGTLFERAYCMQAVCSPSRNALLTGLRPEVLKIYDLGTNFRKRVPEV